FAFSPTRPSTAISIELLELYRALFERSCNAVTALASALHTLYYRRGFEIVSQARPGQLVVDPFRKGLSHAVQWYANLQDRIRRRVEGILASAENTLLATEPLPPQPPPPTPPTPTPPPPTPTPSSLTVGRADRVLRQRCPLCFDLRLWGRPLSEGGDVQLGGDACFSYRHLKSAGDGPTGYKPELFIPREQVALVKDRIRIARTRAPASRNFEVSEETIQTCEQNWEAANEKKRKADPKRYDASGIFALLCRHSQVLYMCDVDTPGEQQQFILACLEEVARHLPPQATIVQAYDVGCVLDRSCNLYPILADGLRERVSFVINAMHAFGHEWICQLFYNPRFRRGMGLTDAEGPERLWSLIRKLIPLTRAQWNSRRIWMLDQHVMFVNEEGLDALGTWLDRQYKKNVLKKKSKAVGVLRDCGVSEDELRDQWEQQKAAQRSHQTHAPARLRKELDKVLALQTQIDILEKSISDTKQSINSAGMSPDSLSHLQRLEASHRELSTEADALYSTLNIHGTFPNLRSLPLEFVRTLLMMRDLKMNIRRRAIGSFYEWETLDRAVAGRREALGTKLHQSTRQAILKRQPALLRSINKFNSYCAELEELRPAGCTIPIPRPLSTQLNGLRSDPSLHEDVWIEVSQHTIPRWQEDEDVRDGIRNLHLLDRCKEEVARLNLERQNLRRWLDHENLVVSQALNTISDVFLLPELHKRQRRLGHLEASWQQELAQTTSAAAVAADFLTSTSAPTYASASATPAARFDVTEALEGDIPVALEELGHELSDVEDTLDVQDVFVNDGCEGEETTGVEDTSVSFSMTLSPSDIKHHVVRPGDLPNLWIEPDDINRISSRTQRLNGFGLNGVAASLDTIFANAWISPNTAANAATCAVFSTYDLPRIRYKCSDTELWRFVAPLKYWGKRLWLIPIHRQAEEHWVFAVVSVPDRRIFFFDSLSQRQGWRRDIRDIMVLITRLVALANRNAHQLHLTTEDPNEPWGYPHQTNGYDCGIWVLCMMAAILRGAHVTGLQESDIGHARQVIRDHICTLPFT
ncbi:hypothetical protein FB45DRAFT_746128, partial [Roridomyces roridus]